MLEEYQYIKEVHKENFLMGGLIYHHKKITDKEMRDREFSEKVHKVLDKNYTKKEIGIMEIPYLINNIISSQSLNEQAMERIFYLHNNDVQVNPVEKIYNKQNHKNSFISESIKIIPGDIIIFISMKGIVGDIFDQKVDNQELFIRYRYDDELRINIGEVFDNKIIKDYLEYDKYITEMEGVNNE